MSFSTTLISRICNPRKKMISRALGLKLKRRPNCLRLQSIQYAGTHLDLNKWGKVKQEVLGGAFNSSPGGIVAYSRFRVDVQNFTRASSMQVKYTFDEKCKMYLVHKDKWSRAELDDIATNSLYFGLNILWTLPNMDKVMSLNEAAEFTNFLCKLDSFTFDSEFLDEGEWETIGGSIWDESMKWMNPSPQRVDLVVENLKKLCSELKIELEEV